MSLNRQTRTTKCPNCHGHGEITRKCQECLPQAPTLLNPAPASCPSCADKGTLRVPCGLCNGRGVRDPEDVASGECPACRGTRRTPQTCRVCGGTGRVGRRGCMVCDGEGTMMKTCRACYGRGVALGLGLCPGDRSEG
jgi:DnaJ-class molecular chaperone